MVGIYIITNKIDGKRYIGQSIDIFRRFQEHRCVSHETNVHLKRALQKYGKENFTYEILEECEESELNEKEIYYIQKLKPEYNVSLGGQNGMRKYPESVKEVIRQKAKEQWDKMPDSEKKQRIKNNLTGRKRGFRQSEDTKEKLRLANLGKKQSTETINRRKATVERKKKNGYRQTNQSHKKKVICLETKEVFESVKEAAEHIGAHPSSITGVLKKRYKTCKGFHFEYLKV